jgi:hypothetical protein
MLVATFSSVTTQGDLLDRSSYRVRREALIYYVGDNHYEVRCSVQSDFNAATESVAVFTNKSKALAVAKAFL